jgi:hypothetical protein
VWRELTPRETSCSLERRTTKLARTGTPRPQFIIAVGRKAHGQTSLAALPSGRVGDGQPSRACLKIGRERRKTLCSRIGAGYL